MNYQNYQDLMLLTSSDTKRTLMHLFLFTNSAHREMDAEYTQLQLTFLALQAWCCHTNRHVYNAINRFVSTLGLNRLIGKRN